MRKKDEIIKTIITDESKEMFDVNLNDILKDKSTK